MSFEEFSGLLDQVPRTPRTIMVEGVPAGEVRHVPLSAYRFAEFRRRPSRTSGSTW